ncbi:hypothetical protein [Salinicoccus albus]|uniref:hypothetical protein n=1 Tax=Salinicoccus albus TaxID=418756 RepID=UPI000378375B|nr:hypothetical protein [Salinicoccus albus]
MNSYRWLNFFLTIAALAAVYIFLSGRINPDYHLPLIIAIGIVCIVSFIFVIKKESHDEDDSHRKR